MVELTIEEKAKRYDEAIKIAKSKIRYDRDHILNEDDIIAMFPELKQSEDESIRKALLEMVNDTKGDDLWINYNVHKEDAAAWLEKQTDNRVNLLEVKGHTYSGVTFKYNGHIWGMCARDGGVEILVDGKIKERVFLDNEPENKSAIENQSKTPITQYCCILDFNTGKVFKHCITEDEVNLTSNELLYKLGCNADECSIMYTSNNLELELLES